MVPVEEAIAHTAEFDELVIGMLKLGLEIPDNLSNSPSNLHCAELEELIDKEFLPFTFRHIQLSQYVDVRRKIYLARRDLANPAEVSADDFYINWNKKDSVDFKRRYLEKYLRCPLIIKSINPSERAYARTLAKTSGVQEKYPFLFEEAA